MLYSIIDIQQKLKQEGYYRGRIDGISGRITKDAIRRFKLSIGLPNTDIAGPLFIAGLFDGRDYSVETIKEIDSPAWLRIAKSYNGIEEVVGFKNNPIITGWWQRLGLPFNDDETPWCAAYVGGCFEECGIRSSRSGMARSYERWGVSLPGPALGAVVTSWRGSKVSGNGHVQIVAGRKGNTLLGIGGNQSNKVSIVPVALNRVIAYSYPASYPRPKSYNVMDLPQIDASGRIGSEE